MLHMTLLTLFHPPTVCMLALIGCTCNECRHWSPHCMPPVVLPHLGPAPAGLLSLVWAAKRRSACTSVRSTRTRPCQAAQWWMRKRKARRVRSSLRARGRPPAAPARRRRANQRATQSQVREHSSLQCFLIQPQRWRRLCLCVFWIFCYKHNSLSTERIEPWWRPGVWIISILAVASPY